MTDLFQEIEEELKRDRAALLWKKYGRYVIGAAAGIVLATLAYQAWLKWDFSQRVDQSDRFAQALEQFDTKGAEASLGLLAELADPDGGYGTLAAFERARLLAEVGDSAGAIEIWDQLSANEESGPAYQSLATILAVLQQIDDGDPDALTARLQPLTAAGKAFRPIALELSAALALRAGDRARARDLYTMVADDLTAPPGQRGRATRMIAALKD